MAYIGEIIKKERCKQGIHQSMLARGLCSVSMLSKIEAGECFLSAKLGKELLSRLGKSADKLEIIVDKNEYELEEKKRKILQLLEKREIMQMKEEIALFQKLVSKGDYINQRFMEEMQIACQLLAGRKIGDLGEEVRNVLAKTAGEIKAEEIGKCCLSIEELKLCYLIAIAWSESHKENRKRSLDMLNRIKMDMEGQRWDVEEKAKLYPYICYTLSELYAEEGKWDYVLECCDIALVFLRENKKMICILSLLKNKLTAMKQKRQDKIEEYKIHQNYMDACKMAELEVGFYIDGGLLSVFQRVGGAEYFLLGEVIRGRRKQLKLTQEEFSEKVNCSGEYISRLENGKRSISKKKYEELADLLRIHRERIQTTILTSEYEILEKRRKVGVWIQNGQYEEAKDLLNELKKQIDMSLLENRQSMMCLETIILRKQGKLSNEESFQKYREALQLTIPKYPDIVIGETALRTEEVILLNHIALCYEDCGKMEEAAEILKSVLLSYKNSRMDISYHYRQAVFVLSNYARYLSLLGEHKNAIRYCKMAIPLSTKYGSGDKVSALLYLIGWNLKKMGQNASLYTKYCFMASGIGGLMKEENRQYEILELFYPII